LRLLAAAAIILMALTPRYFKARCCENPDHLSYIDSTNDLFEEELHLAVTHFLTAVASLPPGKIHLVFDVYQHFSQDEYSSRDLDTSNSLSIWQDRDPVHLMDTALMEIGMALLRGDKDDDKVIQLLKKRQGLESAVLVVPAKPEQAARPKHHLRPTG